MTTNGIATVWLPVNDLKRAVGFYGDTLGLTVKSQDEDWAELESSGITIGLNAKDSEEPSPEGGAVVAFRPEGDLDSAAQQLKDKGVEVDGVSEHPWGRIAAFKDPDGNALQLYEPPNA
jgi:predicted enzyme related to lactoylglutathione lyase